jgi:hypothetical protein
LPYNSSMDETPRKRLATSQETSHGYPTLLPLFH